jgi:hypothetical protein
MILNPSLQYSNTPLLQFFWVFGLSYEAGLGDCTAEALRTLSKEVLIKKFSDL